MPAHPFGAPRALAIVCILAALLCGTAFAAEKPRPNIVLIFIDDMGYGDIGPFGSTKNRTPNLDRMAREGMKLTSFYAAPVCSVSRAQVLTGCYGQRVSIPGVLFPGDAIGLSKSEHTVAELLKAQGYATMCIGKWHLGDQPEFLPTRHGFDQYFGLPYSNDMGKKPEKGGVPVMPLVRNEAVLELLAQPEQDRLTERYTDEALKFIRENREHPFFLYMPHTAVHVPIHPGEKFRGKSEHGRYSDWVEEVDWSVGCVLDTLRELKLDSNTLVIFTSDNGPSLPFGKDAGNAGPLRGSKGSTWEGGMREPTIAWWPGRIAPGSTCDAVAGNIDFLPTFAALAGATVAADKRIDGRDFSPLLFGQSKESQREAHYYYNRHKLEAVRAGPWKLALGPQGEVVGSGNAKPLDVADPGVRLYNLDTDIGERTNVAAEHPDIVQRLQTLAAAMAAELGDGKPGAGVRPPGRVENPKVLFPVAAPAVQVARPKPLDTLKPGDKLNAASAPQIAGQPFTISCDVEPKSGTGVILAHGGSAVGYALHLKDNRAMFTVRTGGAAASITAEEKTMGRMKLEARLAADGSMTLTVNGKAAASGKAAGLIANQPKENLCVGHDDGNPVGEYDGAASFQGTIENLKLVIDTK